MENRVERRKEEIPVKRNRRGKKNYLKLFFIGAWNLLAQKGKIATLMGLFLAMPVNFIFIFSFLSAGSVPDVSQLWFIGVVNGIGMFWFILPSSFELISKAFTIKMVD